MVLDPDDVEDDEEDAPQIAKEKGLIYTLSIQNVQMIYENVHEQKGDCSNDDLIKAFLYYYDNESLDFLSAQRRMRTKKHTRH